MKCLWKVQGHDVLPPIVKIIDQDLHHSVLGPGLVVIALKNERGDANGKYCYVALKHLPKAQRFIKRAAMRKVFSRQKKTDDRPRFPMAWSRISPCIIAVFTFVAANPFAPSRSTISG